MTKYYLLKPGQDPTTEEIPPERASLVMIVAALMLILSLSILALVIVLAHEGIV